MDQSTEKKLVEKNKILNFYKNHKIKIYFTIFILLTVIISLIFFNYKNNKNNIIIGEKYIEAGLYLASNKNDKAKIIYEEIILSKNKFYSILALNTIIEKKLILDKSKILEYFDILQNRVSSKSSYDLIILKKALYLMNEMELQEGKDLLKNLEINNSSLKSIAKELLKN
jgi:hypothetical protein